MSWQDVEERLVEAMVYCWRLPDRERGWLHVQAMWPDIRRHTANGDYPGDADRDARPRLPGLTRRQIGEMEEAFGWLDVIDADDRKLVGMAISRLAGGCTQVPWRQLVRPFPRWRAPDGLRMRYSRALTKVCNAVNARTSAAPPVSTRTIDTA